MITRDKVLSTNDITIQELTIPDTIPVWGGETLCIRQLTRGEQDTYLKRQMGTARLKQDRKASSQQEISSIELYGHDSWLFALAVCDPLGTALFTQADIKVLESKSGEFIGWVARQILIFSNMQDDMDKPVQEKLADEIKN